MVCELLVTVIRASSLPAELILLSLFSRCLVARVLHLELLFGHSELPEELSRNPGIDTNSIGENSSGKVTRVWHSALTNRESRRVSRSRLVTYIDNSTFTPIDKNFHS